MSIFKKNKKTSSETKESIENFNLLKEKPKKIKKKIGFGHKHKKTSKKIVSTENKEREDAEGREIEIPDKQSQLEESIETKRDFENENDFLDDMVSEEEIIPEKNIKSEKKEDWSKSKRKTLVKKDMKGKPVFLEDTGEKIGTVFDSIYDREGNIVGYKIKDNKSDSILSFSLDQFGEDKGGLIFVPSWYTKGVKTIEKLEFKDKISPELTWLLKDHTITEEELYNIFVKHDDIVANYIEEAVALRELLSSRLKILERERITLKEDLMDLTEKRLIKDIDRRKFSEIVMQHRTKANVLDVNIKKCKELLERLEQTSFGILSTNIISKVEKKDQKYWRNRELLGEKDAVVIDKVENPYSSKQYDIQERYNELQEEYNNLKEALESKIEDPYEDKYNNLKQNYGKIQEEYEELKLAVENKTKDPYQEIYNDIKAEYDELQEEYNTIKAALESKIEDPYEDKYNNLKQNHEELQKEYEKLKLAIDNKTKDSYEEIYNDIKAGYDELQEEYNTIKAALENKIEDSPYEDKYNNLKQVYKDLQEEYEELKLSVEKLLQNR